MDPQTLIARRVARELRPGNLVNLGIGIPTLVANYVPPELKIFFQSENGLIGTGPIPEQGMAHPLLTDAGGKPISALPGASTFDSAMSFSMPLSMLKSIRAASKVVVVSCSRVVWLFRWQEAVPAKSGSSAGHRSFRALKEIPP